MQIHKQHQNKPVNWYVKGLSMTIQLSNALPKSMNDFKSMESKAFTWCIHQYDKLYTWHKTLTQTLLTPIMCFAYKLYLSKPFFASWNMCRLKTCRYFVVQFFFLSQVYRPDQILTCCNSYDTLDMKFSNPSMQTLRKTTTQWVYCNP